MMVVAAADVDGSQGDMLSVRDEGGQEEIAGGGHGTGGCQEETCGGSHGVGGYQEDDGAGGYDGTGGYDGAGGDDWQDVPDGQQDRDLGKHGCPPCGLKFRDSYNLKRHVLYVHGARQDLVSCPRPWCEQKFDVLAKMKEHLVGCLKVCSICLKTFNRNDKYAAHQRAHVRMARRMKD